ncbi:MAG: tetratricopeptide repeat protein [Planctomycetota bacterium]|nr:tetratricopeptide repeat protein [Planctomycetota bacterium]
MIPSKINPTPYFGTKLVTYRRRWFAGLLFAGTLFLAAPIHGQDTTPQPPEVKKPKEIVLPESFDGDEDFEEASRLRLNVESVDTLKEIIALAKSAIKKGLNKADIDTANKLIASAYLQKTQEVARTIAPGMSVSRRNKLLNDLLEDLGEAIEYDPLLADAYLMKFQLHASRKEVEAAKTVASDGIAELGPYVDSKKADPDTKVKLSRLLMLRAGTQADVEDGLADLKRSIQYDGANQASVAALGKELIQQGRTDEAITFFQEVLETNPENETLVLFTSELLASNKERLSDALELLNAKIKLLPNSTALLKTRARVHASNKEPELAKADLDKVLEMSKDDVEGLLLRARAAIDADDIEAARKDIDTALEIAPDRIDAILLRSSVAAEQKRFGDAIQDIRMIIKDQPKESPNPALLIQLGLLYSMDNRPAEAIKVFSQVTKLDSENWQAYRMRGDTFLAIKDYPKAISDFEKALELAPKDREERSGILNNLSWTLSTSVNEDVLDGKRALELGLEACELTDYKKPHILSTLAAAYARVGDFDKAVEWASKAVELGTDSKEPQLEQLKEELENYRKKQPWLEKAETKQNKVPLAPGASGVDT